VKQIDTEFKIIYSEKGAHIHCALFSKPLSQVTWQKCGDFVIGAESKLDLCRLFDCKWEERED